jgi:putative oxidoreductase
LLAVGLITRLAALVLVIHLTVAFIVVHKMALTGAQNGELAFIYLAGYVTIFLAGPGQYSADAVIFGKSS